MLKPYTGSWTQAQSALRVWYATGLGGELHARVAARTEALLRDLYALHCLQVGGTQRGVDLLAGRGLVHRIHVTGDGADGMRAAPAQLPLASRSVDLVLLCHALEYCEDPHGLLREADRVLALDGHLLIVGFNPWSLFGARRLFGGRTIAWRGRFYSPTRIEDWFRLLGLRACRCETVWMRPPTQHPGLRRHLAFMERAQRLAPACGGVYFLLARKQSIPLSPIQVGRQRNEPVRVPGTVQPTQYGETQWRNR